MAQTDARAGFRLPWSSDRQPTEPSDGESTPDQHVAAAAASTGWPSEDSTRSHAVAPVDITDESGMVQRWTDLPTPAPTPAPTSESGPEHGSDHGSDHGSEPSGPRPSPSGKKPTKFMADLTRAMQAAADDARSRSLSQLQADAKTHVETIHGRSSTEAASLRRAADDDVAGVREWSKAEIARIREETESRITDRKARLDSEIEAHAGVIEREIDAVQKTVAAFEDEMAAFFERLLGEEDPTRFATMAENLPEAPTFEGIVASPEPEIETPEAVAETVETGPVEPEAVEPEAAEAVVETVADDQTEAPTEAPTDVAADEPTIGEVEADSAAETHEHHGSGDGSFEGGEGDGEGDREAAFAAIQAAAEAAASAEVAADAAARAEAVADVAIEIIGNDQDSDPRFAALGLSPDYDAAEAEAALAAAGHSDEEIPEIGDDALAARLAGLVPKGKGNAADKGATQIVVVGLVSVASIASFKRHLGRVPGVQSVGVSSGPDGEFIFLVNHGGDVVLRDAIPGLPSFQARVTGSADGVIHVTAHDPEADA